MSIAYYLLTGLGVLTVFLGFLCRHLFSLYTDTKSERDLYKAQIKGVKDELAKWKNRPANPNNLIDELRKQAGNS